MRCFVISPIGVPGSDVREHADDVFDFIIKPACERAGITPIRADHDTRPGVITEQMYDSILGDDLLIAVLSFHNPNVFYEIAIAEAAARPLILMIQHGDAIPFDIKDRRVLSYDLRPRPLHNKVYENALHQAIRDTLAASQAGSSVVPFRPSLTPLGNKATSLRLLERTSALEASDRIQLARQAEKRLGLRGLAFFNLPQRLGVAKEVRETAARGVDVRVLLMHPENPALQHHLRNVTSSYFRTIQAEVRDGIELWTSTLDGFGEVRLQTSGMMTGMLQFNDRAAILTPYSLAGPTADSPCLDVTAENAFYHSAVEEFDAVWDEMSEPAVLKRPRPSRGGRSSGSSKPRSGAGRKSSARRTAGRGAASR